MLPKKAPFFLLALCTWALETHTMERSPSRTFDTESDVEDDGFTLVGEKPAGTTSLKLKLAGEPVPGETISISPHTVEPTSAQKASPKSTQTIQSAAGADTTPALDIQSIDAQGDTPNTPIYTEGQSSLSRAHPSLRESPSPTPTLVVAAHEPLPLQPVQALNQPAEQPPSPPSIHLDATPHSITHDQLPVVVPILALRGVPPTIPARSHDATVAHAMARLRQKPTPQKLKPASSPMQLQYPGLPLEMQRKNSNGDLSIDIAPTSPKDMCPKTAAKKSCCNNYCPSSCSACCPVSCCVIS